jgi:nitrite reductase/ring-hydroxylating ferredoxin subunit
MDPEKPATMVAFWQARLIGAVEEMGWLEAAQKAITPLLEPLLDAAQPIGLKDVLHGRQLGQHGPGSERLLTFATVRVNGVDVDGRKVLIHQRGLVISAMENACAHLGGPLDEGEVADGVVTCPWHGSRFRLDDGHCVRGPSTFSQLRLMARISGNVIEVRGRAG